MKLIQTINIIKRIILNLIPKFNNFISSKDVDEEHVRYSKSNNKSTK